MPEQGAVDDEAAPVASTLSWNTALSRTAVSSLSRAILSGNHYHSVHGLDDVIRAVRTLNLERYRNEDFTREEKLREGATYMVEKCVSRDERIVAVKHLKINNSGKMFHTRLGSVILEVQIMHHAPLKAHPNIITTLGYGWNTHRNVVVPYVVVEHASLGTLREYIKHRSSSVLGPEDRSRSLSDLEILLGDIVSGLTALHVCGIVHGDMKLDNVLVFPSEDRPAKALVKISDFGHALLLNGAAKSQDPASLIYSGTAIYNAPEVGDQGNHPIDPSDLPKCDVWALGLLIWEACIGGEEYPSYLRRNHLVAGSSCSLDGLDQQTLLKVAKRSLPKRRFGASMFLQIAIHRALQKDPALRAPTVGSLSLHTKWNFGSASKLQAALALHVETSAPTYELFRLDNDRDIPWAHRQQIMQSLVQTFQDKLVKESGQILWQVALCYHLGFGTARDAPKAADYARMAQTVGHPVAEAFSHLLQDHKGLDTHQGRGSYATQVLRLLRSDPSVSVGLPPLVKAFFEGDETTAHSLFEARACVCSSTVDGCGALHWLFAFQDQSSLDGIINSLRKKTKHCLAFVVDLPFSTPRDVHCQWLLRLLGNPLAVAISVNSLMTVKALLGLGADPFAPAYSEVKAQHEDHRHRWTAFHVAARYHCADILQYLVEHSKPGKQKSHTTLGVALSFSTPLERLAMHGSRRKEQLDQTIRVIQSIQPLNAEASNGMTALMQAIDFQDYDVVASLLQAAPELASSPFYSPGDRQTFTLPFLFAVQIAAHRDTPDTVEIPELLNSYTHQLNASTEPPRDHAWRTPLHLAASGPSSTAAQWVLQRNPSLLDVEDGWGRTPLHYCTSAAPCTLLLRRGANPNHADNYGMMALHWACMDRASELVTALLEAKPNLGLRDNKYGTPLHCAVLGGSVEVAQLLLEAGAPVNMTDRMSNTAVHVAAKFGRYHILRMLMQFKADPTLRNVHGRDARNIASDEDGPAHRAVLRLLPMRHDASRPLPDQHSLTTAEHRGRAGADFFWAQKDLETVAPAAHLTDSQVGDLPRYQATDDQDDFENIDDGYGTGDLSKKIYDTVMDVVDQTVQVYRALQVYPSNPIHPEFLDCIVRSSLALARGGIWHSDQAGHFIAIMARTANDLAVALAPGSNIPRFQGFVDPPVGRSLGHDA